MTPPCGERLPCIRACGSRNRYVYAVVSRRSKGISIGVNLNPDKVCNFDCIYCCVNRKTPGQYKEVDPVILREELSRMLEAVRSGRPFSF